MNPHLPVLIATSVVRGSQQGESHGGVYLVDFSRRKVRQCIDWNDCDIDFSGRGWDRGLRGIAFHGDRIYIAASDRLLAYDQAFNLLGSWSNRYLRHCHEIAVKDEMLFLSSTGFDSLLGFNLEREEFVWGACLFESGMCLIAQLAGLLVILLLIGGDAFILQLLRVFGHDRGLIICANGSDAYRNLKSARMELTPRRGVHSCAEIREKGVVHLI